MSGIFIGFQTQPTRFGGTNRVNRTIAEILRRRFPIATRAADADLQVLSLSWEAPSAPPRLFIDHGSFADPGFWAFTAPKLRTRDAILVSSRVCLEISERILAEPRPTMKRVPYFADTTVFRPADDREAFRRQTGDSWSLPRGSSILVAVSGYNRRKNLHLAIRFHHALSQHHPGATLVIVGRPTDRASSKDYAAYLRNLARELGTDDAVRFLETMPHSQLGRMLAAADLLVHLSTSRIENFGLVVAEALASGLPVLASDWGGLRDLVRPGETGFLARTFLSRHGPRVDWRPSVEPVASLLGESETWKRMSDGAACFAAEHLGVEAFEERFCQAVEEVLRRPRAEDGPVRLTDRGQDLMFATIRMHRVDPSIRSTSEEYRRLLDVERGELSRFLSGPAASLEQPPRIGPDHRLYPAVAFRLQGDVLQVTDPAWPGDHKLPQEQAMLAELSDGTRSISEIGERLPSGLRSRARLLESAQSLVDRGLLCPMPAGRLR